MVDELVHVQHDSAESIIEGYAKNSFVTPEFVAKRVKAGRACARSFLGVVIEVNNRRWGVLLIDSQHEKLPKPQSIQHSFRWLAVSLGAMLERK